MSSSSPPPPPPPPPRPRRAVVTAFVRDARGRLLLVRRSDSVSTYRGRWGGVSGGVERGDASILRRALIELEEEVQLAPSQLRLVSAGRPLPVDDDAATPARRFLVYPFLFDFDGGDDDVRLNWENSSYDWVAPSDVPRLQHVPLLPETMRRVLLPPRQAAHVRRLRDDRAHGAAELAAEVLRAVRDVAAAANAAAASAAAADDDAAPASGEAQEQQGTGGGAGAPHADAAADDDDNGNGGGGADDPAGGYRTLCFHLACARPSMAAVANAAADVMLRLDAALAAGLPPAGGAAAAAAAAAGAGDTVHATLLRVLDGLERELAAQQAATEESAARLLRGRRRVMTTSLSSTVANALVAAHDFARQQQQQTATAAAAGEDDGGDGGAGAQVHRGLCVVACESRPLCEGVALAQRLSDAGVAVELITDAQAAIHVGRCDLVLLGADAVTPAGVVNKAGSALVALAAREKGVPVAAATAALKISGGPVAWWLAGAKQQQEGQEEEQEEPAAEELFAGWGDGAAAREVRRRLTAAGGGGGGAPAAAAAAIRVRNVYFEAVALPLLTAGVATDRGLLPPAAVAGLIAERARGYARAFRLPEAVAPEMLDVRWDGASS